MKRAATSVALAFALALVTLFSTERASAASRVVVVDDADRTTRAATERLRGELAAAGFDVVPRVAHGGDARDDVEGEGTGDTAATVRLVRNAQTHAAEFWVSDRLTGKTLVRRVNADPERSPRLVALRGVELLRASLLEITSPPHDDAPPATPALAQPPAPEIARFAAPAPARPLADRPTPPPASRRWIEHAAFDAGIAVLASTDRLGPAAAPKLGAWVALPASLALRLQLVGPAFQSGLANAVGTAVVRQEFASVDFAWAPAGSRVVAPFVALGGGPYHLHIDGSTSLAGYHSASNDAWAALFAAGIGLALRVASSVSIAAEGRALLIAPHPEVTIGNERVASAGSPSLLGSLSLLASF